MVALAGTQLTVRRAGLRGALLRSAPWDSTKEVRNTMHHSTERKATADGGKLRISKGRRPVFFVFPAFFAPQRSLF